MRVGGRLACDAVDPELGRGEILALLGQNGAGTSTLIEILASVVAAHSGELQLDGRPFFPGSADSARIAFIHQDRGSSTG